MAIYENYYQCRREPFSLSPDPSFLFVAPQHAEALAQLRYLVEQRKGFAVITGEVGTGKTMLLRSLIDSLGLDVRTAYIFNPPRSREALYEAIAEELEIDLEGNRNPAATLNRHFLEMADKRTTIVLIFDEAQSLEASLLEEIRLLTNIETSSSKLVQVILAGQTELDLMLDSSTLRALRQRLIFRYSLTPLRKGDSERYIAARFEAAGANRSPFTRSACEAIHRYSSGIPRLINVICDNALLAGYADNRTVIDKDLVDEVAVDLKLLPAKEEIAQNLSMPPQIANLNEPMPSRIPFVYALIIACAIMVVGIAAISTMTAQGSKEFLNSQFSRWLIATMRWFAVARASLLSPFRPVDVSL